MIFISILRTAEDMAFTMTGYLLLCYDAQGESMGGRHYIGLCWRADWSGCLGLLGQSVSHCRATVGSDGGWWCSRKSKHRGCRGAWWPWLHLQAWQPLAVLPLLTPRVLLKEQTVPSVLCAILICVSVPSLTGKGNIQPSQLCAHKHIFLLLCLKKGGWNHVPPIYPPTQGQSPQTDLSLCKEAPRASPCCPILSPSCSGCMPWGSSSLVPGCSKQNSVEVSQKVAFSMKIQQTCWIQGGKNTFM